MGGTQSTTKKKAPPPTISAADRAVLDLKNARDRLSRYQKKLEVDEAKLVEKARQAKYKGQTRLALQLLKIKAMKTRDVQQVETQLLNVLQMVQTLDSKQNEQQVLAAMKVGKDALAKMHQETTVEDVLDLMDQIQEQNELELEISNILQGTPELSIQDEAAVEAELAALMESESTPEAVLPQVPSSKPLPVAPTTKLPDPKDAVATEQPRVAVPS